MNTESVTGLMIKYVDDTNATQLTEIYTALPMHQGKLEKIFGTGFEEDINSAFVRQREEYGTGLGLVEDNSGAVIGLAGLVFLEEVQLYELVVCMMPEYSSLTYDVIDMLLYEAFENMSLDKVCAREPIDSSHSTVLREIGFAYIDERIFMDDHMQHVWAYYELENDTNVVSASDDFSLEFEFEDSF